VRVGDSIPSKIEDGLEGSRVLLFCNSEHVVGSAWAKFELQTFQFRDPLNRERRYVVLRLDDTPLTATLAPLLYVDWRNGDANEFEKLVLACRMPPPEAEGAGPQIPPARPIPGGGSGEIHAAAHRPDGPSTEHASVWIGRRYASFAVPHGWAERTGVEISAIQAIEGDLGTVHSQLYRFNDPALICALTILSAAMPASMLTPENLSQLVLSAERHTGLHAVSSVTPVSLDGAAGWCWHLQGVVPGTELALAKTSFPPTRRHADGAEARPNCSTRVLPVQTATGRVGGRGLGETARLTLRRVCLAESRRLDHLSVGATPDEVTTP
jgi:TIR domain